MTVFLWVFLILSCLSILGKLVRLGQGDDDAPIVIIDAVSEIAMFSWALVLLFGR